MFNIGKLISTPPKFTIEKDKKNIKNVFNHAENDYKYNKYLNNSINEYSVNKFDNLLIKINEEHKRKKDIQNILYGNSVIIKTTNRSVMDLINNSKKYNFLFLISFMSTISAFIFYKNR